MKNKIKLLDCTLRDGGYINNWNFGFEEAQSITKIINRSGVDYIEVGFIGPYTDTEGIVRFSSMEALTKVFSPLGAKLTAMVYAEGYSATAFPTRSKNTVDMIRVIFWKRNLAEGVNYVKTLIKKGYEVGVQLARTEQYDLNEIKQIIQQFNPIHPTAIYLVDSFGTFDAEKTLQYAEIYDANLEENILLGFHAHNNMQQALTNSIILCEHKWNHDLILDASVMGMGRGAGNLNIELIMNYINSKQPNKYELSPIISVADKYITKYMDVCKWGYSIPYFLSAVTGRNPSYVNYMIEKNLCIEDMEKIFYQMKLDEEGIRFDPETCDKLIKQIYTKK